MNYRTLALTFALTLTAVSAQAETWFRCEGTAYKAEQPDVVTRQGVEDTFVYRPATTDQRAQVLEFADGKLRDTAAKIDVTDDELRSLERSKYTTATIVINRRTLAYSSTLMMDGQGVLRKGTCSIVQPLIKQDAPKF